MAALLCGAAEIDITPNIGLPTAAYSTDGKEAVGVLSHLFARALYVEDAEGEKVAFCVVDLHSGTGYLLETAASRTEPSFGVSVDRLVLRGTHTQYRPRGMSVCRYSITFDGEDRRRVPVSEKSGAVIMH
jgi:hypothetical protein